MRSFFAEPGRSEANPPPGRTRAEGEEMTFASHPERQFMQYLRGAGWIKAGALPPSARLLEKLLQKGWIEQQEQGPNNEVFFRLTDRGLEAKKSPVPSGRTKANGLAGLPKAKGKR